MEKIKGDIPLAIKKLVSTIPDDSIGTWINTAYVNKAEGLLPGQFRGNEWAGVYDKSFRDAFFPYWSSLGGLEERINELTGLKDDWWQKFSIALVCQSIGYNTTSAKGRVKLKLVNKFLNDCNIVLHSSSTRFYAATLASRWPPLRTFLANTSNLPQAKKQYIQCLKDNIQTRQLWYINGMWKSPDWEMFHHYIKLLNLGATESEIDSLIDQLYKAGLPISPLVTKDKWRSYTSYLRQHPIIDHKDLIDSRTRPAMRVYWGDKMHIIKYGRQAGLPYHTRYKVDYPSQFLDGPGKDFASSGGGSCFTGDTCILMADGTRKAIEDIKTGDMVCSLEGPRAVALKMTVLRRDRPLYSINGESFGFTDTHPFANALARLDESTPSFLTIDPDKLSSWVPALAQHGITELQMGSIVEAHDVASGEVEPWVIQSLDRYSQEEESKHQFVYDLMLVPNETGLSHYYAGSAEKFILVSTEMPDLYQSPMATVAFVQAFQKSIGKILSDFNDFAKKHPNPNKFKVVTEYVEKLYAFRPMLMGSVVPMAIAANANSISSMNIPKGYSIENSIKGLVKGIAQLDEASNIIMGVAFETIASALVAEIEMAAELGWRSLEKDIEGDFASISVGELMLEGDHPIDLNSTMELKVTLRYGDVISMTHIILDESDRVNTHWARYFDDVVYLAGKTDEDDYIIQFEGRLVEEDIPIFKTWINLPVDPIIYGRRHLPIYSALGEYMGSLAIDIRGLSTKTVEEEKQRRDDWSDKRKLNFALRLGDEIGKILCSKEMEPLIATQLT